MKMEVNFCDLYGLFYGFLGCFIYLDDFIDIIKILKNKFLLSFYSKISV